MEPWHLAHLVVLAAWGGLVAAEAVVELTARTDEQRRHTATIHYWMDLLVELPLLAGVVVTGAVLVAQTWPLGTRELVKIGAGLAAVAANGLCVVHVVLRHRRASDRSDLARHERAIRLSAAVGLPFAAVALALGLTYLTQ